MVHKDFDRFGDVHLARSQGDFIQCDRPRSKHEFLRYLRDERGAVLHGSNKPLGLCDAEGHEEKMPIAEVEDRRQYGKALRKRISQWA